MSHSIRQGIKHTLLLILSLFILNSAFGQVNKVVPYQGTITDTSGTPFDGNFDFQFQLKNQFGSSVWSSGNLSLDVDFGAYHLVLGEAPQPNIPTSLWKENDQLFLEITFNDGINGAQTLSPDVELLPLPYAIRSCFADQYCGDSLSTLLITADSIISKLICVDTIKGKVLQIDTIHKRMVVLDTFVFIDQAIPGMSSSISASGFTTKQGTVITSLRPGPDGLEIFSSKGNDSVGIKMDPSNETVCIIGDLKVQGQGASIHLYADSPQPRISFVNGNDTLNLSADIANSSISTKVFLATDGQGNTRVKENGMDIEAGKSLGRLEIANDKLEIFATDTASGNDVGFLLDPLNQQICVTGELKLDSVSNRVILNHNAIQIDNDSIHTETRLLGGELHLKARKGPDTIGIVLDAAKKQVCINGQLKTKSLLNDGDLEICGNLTVKGYIRDTSGKLLFGLTESGLELLAIDTSLKAYFYSYEWKITGDDKELTAAEDTPGVNFRWRIAARKPSTGEAVSTIWDPHTGRVDQVTPTMRIYSSSLLSKVLRLQPSNIRFVSTSSEGFLEHDDSPSLPQGGALRLGTIAPASNDTSSLNLQVGTMTMRNMTTVNMVFTGQPHRYTSIYDPGFAQMENKLFSNNGIDEVSSTLSLFNGGQMIVKTNQSNFLTIGNLGFIGQEGIRLVFESFFLGKQANLNYNAAMDKFSFDNLSMFSLEYNPNLLMETRFDPGVGNVVQTFQSGPNLSSLVFDPTNSIMTFETIDQLHLKGAVPFKIIQDPALNSGSIVLDATNPSVPTNTVKLIFEPGTKTLTVDGDFNVLGTVSANVKSFRIDHPLDPYNKDLVYTSMESPEMINVYNGRVTTDASGKAWVSLPTHFEALNIDFKYQLTVIGKFAQAIVKKEIENNEFLIATDKGNVEVSWQVTGVRDDPFARENRTQVEQDKSGSIKGNLRYMPKKASKR